MDYVSLWGLHHTMNDYNNGWGRWMLTLLLLSLAGLGTLLFFSHFNSRLVRLVGWQLNIRGGKRNKTPYIPGLIERLFSRSYCFSFAILLAGNIHMTTNEMPKIIPRKPYVVICILHGQAPNVRMKRALILILAWNYSSRRFGARDRTSSSTCSSDTWAGDLMGAAGALCA